METNPKPSRLIKSITPDKKYLTGISHIYGVGRRPSLSRVGAVNKNLFEKKDELIKKQSVISEARAKAEALDKYKKKRAITRGVKAKTRVVGDDKGLPQDISDIISSYAVGGRKPSKSKRKSKTQKRKSKTQKNKKSK